MGGHCFLDRCNHLRQSDKEEVSVLISEMPGIFVFRYNFAACKVCAMGLLGRLCLVHCLKTLKDLNGRRGIVVCSESSLLNCVTPRVDVYFMVGILICEK